ncbi:hypothetical protein BDN67DRAFT_267534 [Paxillus ammoniavirescens]|nr:hypothetical protein BDN67DRAFT_267534 [Paxillus ammoniavirescens]
MVVSGSWDKTVQIWNGETGKLAFEPIKCHRGSVECVRYSPSGDRIASASGPTVQIWNAETGVGILSIRDSAVSSLAWTADDTYLIGGAEFTQRRTTTHLEGPRQHRQSNLTLTLTHENPLGKFQLGQEDSVRIRYLNWRASRCIIARRKC